MPKIVHKATGPNGEAFKRTSTTRAYSHVAIGRPCYRRAMAFATSPAQTSGDVRNFKFYESFVDGSSRFLLRNDWERDDDKYNNRVTREVATAREALGGHKTALAYSDAKREERVAAVEARKAAGDFDRFVALGWSSRLDLAEKVASSKAAIYAETRVIAVELGK